MSQNRFYSSTAATTTTTSALTAGATSIPVAALTGYPASLPWTGIIARGTASEEVVTVTAVAGTTLTVTRGQDGTSGVSHLSGVTFEHGVSARDFDEPQAHIAKTTGAHGVTGNFVGDTDVQTLTNKTLTAPTISTVQNGGTLTLPTSTDTVVGRATADTLTNKSVDLANNTVTGTKAQFNTALSDGDFASQAGAETLTNKTLNGAVLDAASTHGGVSGTTLAADQAAWANYTPVWTGATTNPAIGNGSIAGRYKQVGKTVFVEFFISMGSSTTFGTGNWSFTLPVAADTTHTLGALSGHVTGLMWSQDASVPAAYSAQIVTAGSTFHVSGGASTMFFDVTTPFIWATNDNIRGSFFYEAA